MDTLGEGSSLFGRRKEMSDLTADSSGSANLRGGLLERSLMRKN